MQKIGQLQTYVLVTESHKPVFYHPDGSDQSRLIKMRVRAEQATNLYVEPLDADPETGELPDVMFLAHIAPGLDQVEFYYLGSFALMLAGGNVWLDTYDNTSFEVQSIDDVSFARLWEREERDPRILEMEQAARHNRLALERQREADRADYEARVAALEERFKNVSGTASPPVAPAPSVPAQSASVPAADGEQHDPAS